MKPRKREIILVALLAAILVIWVLWPKPSGSTVTVTVDGKQTGTYGLSQDRTLRLTGHDGFSLTMVIENGKAHVEDSTCPDLICQHHSAISRSGEQIVCLPARIILTVSSDEEEGFDAVAQ